MEHPEKIIGITDLREDLLSYYEQARKGQVNVKEIGHISQLAGKIINSAKTQLQYHIHMEIKSGIPFLDK